MTDLNDVPDWVILVFAILVLLIIAKIAAYFLPWIISILVFYSLYKLLKKSGMI